MKQKVFRPRALRYTQGLSKSKACRGGRSTSSRQAFAIILVLAVLVLLALLSLTYIKLALIDRNIARNYMDNKRAKLIAQSGVEYAIARLQEDFFDTSWQEQKSIKINGANTNYTESSGSTYGENRDIFIVKVEDSNSMINVNDGLGNDRVKENTKRILNVLGDVVGIVNLGNKIIDNRPPQGYTSKQELLKVISKPELETLKDLITTHAWQDPDVANPVPLSNVVISAYGDPYANYDAQIGVYRYGRGKDASGNLISGDLVYAPEFATVKLYDIARPEYFVNAIYALDELNPQWIEIVSRSPVNINTASQQVLIALLKDLKGFFVSERIRPYYPGYYEVLGTSINGISLTQFDYAPNIYDHMSPDELGFLYSTESISSSLAQAIAGEIIKCRESDPAYATKWFRGQFKSWRQFNAFVDNLVPRTTIEYKFDPTKIIKDSRETIFVKYTTNSSTSDMKKSPEALLFANQAKADVLKANFNPNLHLNELNPDANIKTLVDKVDLIVNSTEFCFTPTGYFQIESEGLVLKPSDVDNIIIANSKVEVVIKLFDAYRETNQKQFLNHVTSKSLANYLGTSASRTNNGRTIELGPEPSHIFDVGGNPLAKENEYSGYISLPTVTGPGLGPSAISSTPIYTKETKTTPYTMPPFTYTTTKETTVYDEPKQNWATTIIETTKKEFGPTEASFDEVTETTSNSYNSPLGPVLPVIYGGFMENFGLNYHAGGNTALVSNHNAADKTELGPGPYVYNARNKLCRSYRDNPDFIPDPLNYAPTDFRLDGAYAERHSGLAYSIDCDAFRNLGNQGVACYWLKPSFYPEQTSKPRGYLSISDADARSIFPVELYGVLFFGNYYFATKDSSHGSKSLQYTPGGIDTPISDALIFGYTIKAPTEGAGRGQSVPSLCEDYTDPFWCSGHMQYLKSGQWIHVTCAWNFEDDYDFPPVYGPERNRDSYPPQPAEIYINGVFLDGTKNVSSHEDSNFDHLSTAEILNETKILHIGPAGLVSQLPHPRVNWSADSTIDEFYVMIPMVNRIKITNTNNKWQRQVTATITTRTIVKDRFGNVDSDTSETTTSTTTETGTIPDFQQSRNEIAPPDSALKVYRDGRYYKPASQESYYISQDIKKLFETKKSPEITIIDPPPGTSGSTAPTYDSSVRLIGISWTYYVENTDESGRPVVSDYRKYYGEGHDEFGQPVKNNVRTQLPNLEVKLTISILKNLDSSTGLSEAEFGPFETDAYSPVDIEIDQQAEFRYKVAFEIKNIDSLNTVLLYTPVFDDITIYYQQGVQFLSYLSSGD